jgi:hypothetical protein
VSLNFDTERAPMRPGDFADLVRAVVAARSSDEGSWLEWKSRLDLGTAEGKASLARAVVGMANRSQAVAGAHCEGRGFVVVGAHPGEVVGMEELDPAVTEARVRPYLGEGGPRWYPHWVEVNGATVLVVEVAAPRAGDPVHHIHKDGPGVQSGNIFIRRGATTVPPNAAELSALVARATSKTAIGGIRVGLSQSRELSPVDFSTQAIDSWLDRERDRCLVSLRAYRRPQSRGPRHLGSFGTPGGSSGLSFAEAEDLAQRQRDGETLTEAERTQLASALQTARAAAASVAGTLAKMTRWEDETRTSEQYTAQVEAYIASCRTRLPQVARLGAAEHLTPTRFVVSNDTDDNFPEVEVTLHLDGDVEAVKLSRRASNEGRMPRAPEPFGPRQVPRFAVSPLDFAGRVPPNFDHRHLLGNIERAGVDIDNGGSATLTFSPVDLRPGQRNVALVPVVLLAQGEPGIEVRGSWQATSSGVPGIARGELGPIAFTSPQLALSDALTEIEDTDDEGDDDS